MDPARKVQSREPMQLPTDIECIARTAVVVDGRNSPLRTIGRLRPRHEFHVHLEQLRHNLVTVHAGTEESEKPDRHTETP